LALKVAIQMDPIDAIDIDGDSSFRIAEEAQARGHSLFFYTPDKLAYREGSVLAKGWPLDVRREKGNHFTLGAEIEIDLADWDVVWLRQDPPFDMGYITTTHLLDRIHPGTLVVNDPTWVRNWPEKLKVLDYPDLTPPTAIARDLDTLKDELFSGIIIMQKFLPDVAKGDKRVILIDGEPVGGINRVPAAGETRSNMHVGGRAEKTELTERDLEICAKIGQDLKDHGQVFVGIDVIGGWLTEINVGHAVADGLGHVVGQDRFAACQIGDCARDAQHPVIAAR